MTSRRTSPAGGSGKPRPTATSPNAARPLASRVALVAGATRGAGRGIATALGEAGATVYCTGRSTRGNPSPLARPETIEETAELVTAAGGTGIAVRVDHTVESEVIALFARISREQKRLDLLVNDVWGGDSAGDWLWKNFHETDIDAGWALMRQAVFSHMLTSKHAAPLLIAQRRGLIVEITDGDTLCYRGSLFYDLIKTSIMRLAFVMSVEMRPHRVAAVAVSPGFLRSEAMLEHFAVSESNWRDGARKDKHFIASESPRLVGRGVAALAADSTIMSVSGEAFGSWELARRYKLRDIDGRRPDWLAHFRQHIPRKHAARDWMARGLAWQDTIGNRTRKFLR
ncbi:MAG: SDR family oxidoreductase [Gemmatimonadaceae bacterium]|nr:SDR family oxidoreductase [Gemmatimonadaceae bacterium]